MLLVTKRAGTPGWPCSSGDMQAASWSALLWFLDAQRPLLASWHVRCLRLCWLVAA